jgi:hypothetical protein
MEITIRERNRKVVERRYTGSSVVTFLGNHFGVRKAGERERNNAAACNNILEYSEGCKYIARIKRSGSKQYSN